MQREKDPAIVLIQPTLNSSLCVFVVSALVSLCPCFICRGTEEMSGQNPDCEDLPRQEQKLPFQTFLNSLDHNHEKERLPSIVVEPTEVSEVESGELRWPPEDMDMEEDEEDLFLEQCIPPANIADWGEEEVEEETSVILNQQQGFTLIGELLLITGK
uniref:LBH domain-containing protein n=1 Tax=Mastacembelus armatus TaxID=205130 RepID=A0A3Q3M1J8_9TELE